MGLDTIRARIIDLILIEECSEIEVWKVFAQSVRIKIVKAVEVRKGPFINYKSIKYF